MIPNGHILDAKMALCDRGWAQNYAFVVPSEAREATRSNTGLHLT